MSIFKFSKCWLSFLLFHPEPENFDQKLKIVSRGEWGAREPAKLTPLKLPVPNVIIAHTATFGCTTQVF